jgi:hypothetical protein
MAEPIGKTWKEIAVGFLKVGATADGDPAIMAVMQAEFQERRQWTSKPHFREGLALLIRWRLAPLKATLGGSVFGVLRDRLGDLPGMRALLCGATWGR